MRRRWRWPRRYPARWNVSERATAVSLGLLRRERRIGIVLDENRGRVTAGLDGQDAIRLRFALPAIVIESMTILPRPLDVAVCNVGRPLAVG